MKTSPLPEKYLRLMTPEDRRKHGQKSAAEVLAQGEATSEKTLQKQIVGLLRLKGIEPIVSRMDRRTSNNVGTPDIIFGLRQEPSPITGHMVRFVPCAWEVKMPKGVLSEEQALMGHKLRTAPNGWTVRVIRSVDEALAELKNLGIE